MPDDLSATLAGIRERHAARIKSAPGLGADPADFRALLKAVEAALANHEEFDGTCSGCTDAYGDPAAWPCAEYRDITAALAGKEVGHA
jgi:hypothetical protein